MSSFGLIKIVESLLDLFVSVSESQSIFGMHVFCCCFSILLVFFLPFLSIFRSQSQNVELDISKLKCVQSHPVPKVPTDISDNFHANVNDVIINDDFHANVNNVIYQ